MAEIYRISVSSELGRKKTNVSRARIVKSGGIEGDAHSLTDRPLSLLPYESFDKVQHPDLTIKPGDFAENITTLGLDFSHVRVGTRIRLGGAVEIEIIQIGKICHDGCAIQELTGDCIMPREGIFARALSGGELAEGDPIIILD